MLNIPPVPSAQQLLDYAFKRASKVTAQDKKPFFRTKKTALKKLQVVPSVLNDKIKRTVRSFPTFEQLDPFTSEIMDIQFGEDNIKLALGRVDGVRKSVRSICKRMTGKINRAKKREEIWKLRKAAYGRVSGLINILGDPLALLEEVRWNLKRMPTIDRNVFTVVAAGYPNVGKSALVDALSTAELEVAQYPFTTQDVMVGHMIRERKRVEERIQLVDTPGILDRPLEEHNDFERAALSALKNLADAVVYLIDATEFCGYELKRQEALLNSFEEKFRGVPVLRIASKADVGPEKVISFIEKRKSAYGEDWLRTSVNEEETLERISEKLFSIRYDYVSELRKSEEDIGYGR